MIPNLPSHSNRSPTQWTRTLNLMSLLLLILFIEKTPIINKASTNETVTRVMANATKITIESKSATTNSHPKTKDTHSPKLSQTMKTMKCIQQYPNNRSNVAFGTVYISSERQTIHGVPLQDDFYKVSIDEVIKAAAFFLYPNGDINLVEDAHKTFVAWPKYLVKCNEKVPRMGSTQDDEHKSSKKQRKSLTQDDEHEAKKKKLQREIALASIRGAHSTRLKKSSFWIIMNLYSFL
ncbi:unnamed protein product [Lactuca saligna]|uniref:DUF8039 domain-containing protein n=1 Tax=Lactuca saligna TaxID=75948 RepID=A0AA36E764_LACSI|nr:unnamed protein product [Lactuca saligna]